MKNVLTFIIPVRHPTNAKDWSKLKRNLSETIGSISLQDHPDWKAVIVANYGSDLPPLPARFEVKWVDFPPNQLHEQGDAGVEDFREAFRIDKGRRVLAGMLHAGEMGHVMIVDDDDFVSRKLTLFVADNPLAYGWYLRDGYVWGDGGIMLYRHRDFSKICGSSHIVRSDLYAIPKTFAEASDTYIKQMLGSHIFIDKHLAASGTPLAPLPFMGGIYRVGHSGAHSKSPGIASLFFLKRSLATQPLEVLRRFFRLRPVTGTVRHEFFG